MDHRSGAAGGAPDEPRRLFPGTSLPLAGVANLGVLYLVWGSTYLAIRVAVREGSGFPPFFMAMLRISLASLLLLGIARLRGRRVRPSLRELMILGVSGLLLWVGGNGAVVWAEQRVDSGYTALIVGSMPIWVAMMEAVIDRRPPSWRLIAGLVTGFAGLTVLTFPVLRHGGEGDALSVGVLFLGPIAWGLGSILMARRPVNLGPIAISGWQQLIGSFGFALLVLLTGESMPTPTAEAWFAWGYLVIFGSLVAFTSFMAALRLLPTSIVMTYGYVNPVVAVLLGWLILHEPVTGYTIGGTLLILLGVAGVFRDRQVQTAREAQVIPEPATSNPVRRG